MLLNESFLKQQLAGKFIGHRLLFYQETGSTNDEAFRLAIKGEREGTALIAESQSAGRGRMQRVWYSPAGVNIYTSFILRPSFETARAPQISIAAGVAVSEVIDAYCPNRTKLKWPNDVLIGGKKVCGILTQMKTSSRDCHPPAAANYSPTASRQPLSGGIDFVVVGIGLNVNSQSSQFPNEIKNIATSLSIAAQRSISREEVIISLYENMTKWYRELADNGFGAVKKKWLSLSPMIGCFASVMFNGEAVEGEAVGLDDDGSLILRTASDKLIKVCAGDATILKR